MRFIHMADSHLGFAAYGAMTPDGLNQREEDVQRGFSWAVDTAVRERVEAVLHAGDLFDSIRPSNRAVRFAMDEARRLSDAGIAFIVISGNHDTPRMRSTGSVLRLMEHVPGVRAFYGARPGVAKVGDCSFTCLGHVPDSEQFKDALAACVPDGGAAFNVLALHVGIGGVAVFKTSEFNETVVPQGSLPMEFDYIALGHFHGATDVGGGARYAGSLERLTFTEAEGDKGVWLVDTVEKTQKFLRYEPRPMLRLELDAGKMGSADVVGACAELAGSVPDGAIVSLAVKNVDPAARRTLDLRAIRSAFGRTIHLALAVSSAEGLPAPGAALGESGLSDELAAYAKAKGAPVGAAERARGFLEACE